jgi:hypothetical protein
MGVVTTVGAATVGAVTVGAATMAEADMAGAVLTAADAALTTDAVPMVVDIVDAVTSERRAAEDLAVADGAGTSNHVVVAAASTVVVAAASTVVVVADSTVVADMVVEAIAKS